jgi:hypothetical protein
VGHAVIIGNQGGLMLLSKVVAHIVIIWGFLMEWLMLMALCILLKNSMYNLIVYTLISFYYHFFHLYFPDNNNISKHFLALSYTLTIICIFLAYTGTCIFYVSF